MRGLPATQYRTTSDSGGETIDVWVDAADRAVRVGVTPTETTTPTSIRQPPRPDNGEIVSVYGMHSTPSTMEFCDFGIAVDITPPADAQPAP